MARKPASIKSRLIPIDHLTDFFPRVAVEFVLKTVPFRGGNPRVSKGSYTRRRALPNRRASASSRSLPTAAQRLVELHQ
jgi:hypothetical protein